MPLSPAGITLGRHERGHLLAAPLNKHSGLAGPPGGGRSVIAENLILKQQLIIHSRSRERAPNLTTRDHTLLGFLSLFMRPRRIARAAIIIKPSTLLQFHNAVKQRKYRQLYSPRGGRKPGPKGPSKEVIKAIAEMKQPNPRYGCPRIAQQINLAFGLDLDKDTVRRVLATYYKPYPSNRGPSWLTTIGHAKASLWSVDLFRCESIVLKSHWVMVVMNQYVRRMIGFSVHAGNVDGPALCCMSIRRPQNKTSLLISALTTTHYCYSIDGKPICACLN